MTSDENIWATILNEINLSQNNKEEISLTISNDNKQNDYFEEEMKFFKNFNNIKIEENCSKNLLNDDEV